MVCGTTAPCFVSLLLLYRMGVVMSLLGAGLFVLWVFLAFLFVRALAVWRASRRSQGGGTFLVSDSPRRGVLKQQECKHGWWIFFSSIHCFVI